MSSKGRVVLLVAAYLAINPAPVLAYIDPGSGSVIIQVVLAFALGAAFTLKAYLFRLRSFFSGKKSNREKTRSQPDVGGR